MSAEKKKHSFIQAIFGAMVLSFIVILIIGVIGAANDKSGWSSKSPEQQLAELTTWYVAGNGKRLIVWRDSAAMQRGQDFIAAGEARTHARQVMELVSCFIGPGTKLISHGGVFTLSVTVVSGPDDGCDGVVDASAVTHDKPSAER